MLNPQVSFSEKLKKKPRNPNQGVFFYLEITSDDGPQYDNWARAIFPQCETIMCTKTKPLLAFFQREKNRFGCIIKYDVKKTAKTTKRSFSLPRTNDQIQFYFPGNRRTFKKSMFKNWSQHTSKEDQTIRYQVGQILDQTFIEKLIREEEIPKRPQLDEQENSAVEENLPIGAKEAPNGLDLGEDDEDLDEIEIVRKKTPRE